MDSIFTNVVGANNASHDVQNWRVANVGFPFGGRYNARTVKLEVHQHYNLGTCESKQTSASRVNLKNRVNVRVGGQDRMF